MRKVKFRKIFQYFWRISKNYKGILSFTFLGWAIAQILTNIFVPVYYRKLIDLISNGGSNTEIAISLWSIFLTIALLIIVGQICFRLVDYTITRSQSDMLKDLNDLTFSELKFHSYRFFNNEFSGSLVAKVRRFVRSLEIVYDQILFSFWSIVIQLTGTFLVLFLANSDLGLLFLSWSLTYVIISLYLAKKKSKYDLASATADSKVTGRLADVITNILNLKIFSSAEYEQKKYEKVTDNDRSARNNNWYFNNLVMAVQSVLMTILELGAMYFVLKLWLAGSVSTGTVVLVQIYIGIIFSALWHLGRSITRFTTALSDASEMVEILERPFDVIDPSEPQSFEVQRGEIIFKDVAFAYNEESSEVLENFNLEIRPGEKVGIVGHSGAGKTTLTKLLLRFADVTSGEILIDGQDIAKARQDDVRQTISYVPQEPILFHRSLRENIAYGKPGASEEEVRGAAKNARAHEFISEFPQGYETLVGERGEKLSGGERQRVAIARAMLENAPILILDEATSSLDSVNEKTIQEAFEELIKGKTAIVIAHRLSTIRKMDRIIVMDKGEIVEDGTHEELVKKDGIYKELWSHQQGGFIE